MAYHCCGGEGDQNYVYPRGDPLVLYPRFLDKSNSSWILFQRARCPLQFPQVPVPELFLHLPNFLRILTPRARYPQYPTTIPTRSRPWTLTSSPVAYRCWESELHFATWRPPSSCTTGFLIKRIFPEYWPRVPCTHRTLLQSPHGPVPGSLVTHRWGCKNYVQPRGDPFVLYPRFLDKTIFSNTNSAGQVPTGRFYNPHTIPSLNFSWLFRGVPLMGEGGAELSLATSSQQAGRHGGPRQAGMQVGRQAF